MLAPSSRSTEVKAGGTSGVHGPVVQIGAVEAVDGPQAAETERPGEPVDIVGAEAELLGQPLDRRLRGARVDLQADHGKEPAAAQLLLEGEEEVVGGVVVEGQVGVPGDPEDTGLPDVHAGEQLVEERHHDLLEWDEALAPGQGQEAVDVRRDLHPGEALAASSCAAAHLDADVEREVGDVGEGVARVDGQRGDHREDEAVEQLVEVARGRGRRGPPSCTARSRRRPAPGRACRAAGSPDDAPSARARPGRRPGAVRGCCR